MKSKFFKLILSISSVFLFFVTMVLIDTNKVGAANSIDFHYPSTTLGKEYSENGDIILKDTIDVLAHNNGFGYRIDYKDEKNLRISKITIISGSAKKEFSIEDSNFYDYFQVSTLASQSELPAAGVVESLKNANYKHVDKITLNVKKMYEALEITTSSADYYKNDVSIKIDLQLAKYTLWWISSWDDVVDNVNAYKGTSKQDSTEVTFSKTSSDLFGTKLEVTKVELTSNIDNFDNKYTLANYNDRKNINLTVTTNMAITGSMNVECGNGITLSLLFGNISGATNMASISLNSNLLKENLDNIKYTYP